MKFEDKTYQIKLSERFWLGSGVGFVTGYEAWLMSKEGSESFCYLDGHPLIRLLRNGWVNVIDGKLLLTEKGKGVVRQFLEEYERYERELREKRREIATFRRKVLKALEDNTVEIADARVPDKFRRAVVRWEGSTEFISTIRWGLFFELKYACVQKSDDEDVSFQLREEMAPLRWLLSRLWERIGVLKGLAVTTDPKLIEFVEFLQNAKKGGERYGGVFGGAEEVLRRL